VTGAILRPGGAVLPFPPSQVPHLAFAVDAAGTRTAGPRL